MKTNITLPQWLDALLFDELGAKYCPSNADMTVIDWDKHDVLNYLGTYFPRSYTESYCIFSQYLSSNPALCQQSTIRLFDFGCGTGGEIIGFLMALNEHPNLRIKEVEIVAMDGNHNALRLYEAILERIRSTAKVNFSISSKSSPLKIDDFYDLSIIDELKEHGVMFVFMGTNQNVELIATALHIDEYMDFEYSTEGLKSALQNGMNASADYYDRMSQYNQDTKNMSKEERNAYYRQQNEKDGWFHNNSK